MNIVATTLPGLKENWTKLAQISIWVTSVVFTFQSTPPRHFPSMEAETWVNMANFVLAIVLGLTIGFVGKRRKVKAIWRLASACCLVAGLFGFFANMTATDRWTCHFDGRGPMIVGVTLTAEGTDYLRSHPKASCSRMIQDFAGSNVTIWDPIEISTRHAILVALFLATVLAFSLSAVFMLESLRSPARVRRIP